MPRAVDGTRRKNRRKKILKQAKGYWGGRSKLLPTVTAKIENGFSDHFGLPVFPPPAGRMKLLTLDSLTV
jgi:hypothetical protein